MLIPGAPLGLITTSVQALAGLLLPSASVFLLLLCNDPEVLGPWVNPKWLNAVAAVIVGVLLVLSGTLMATTLFPHVDVGEVFIWLVVALAAGGLTVMIVLRVLANRSGKPAASTGSRPGPDGEDVVADATPRPAQAGQVVTGATRRHPGPSLLPGPQRGAAAGQSHPARGRLTAQGRPPVGIGPA